MRNYCKKGFPSFDETGGTGACVPWRRRQNYLERR
jgi:hypothetical protein